MSISILHSCRINDQSSAKANPGHALSNYQRIASCILPYKSRGLPSSIRLFISIRSSLTYMNRSFCTHVGIPPVSPSGFSETHCSTAPLAADILRHTSSQQRYQSVCTTLADKRS